MAQIAVAAVLAVGALYKGAEAKKLKDQEAQGYTDASYRRLAAASRDVSEEERNKEFMYSRALASSAASGGGTGHGVTKLLADLNAEGMYRMMSRLWVGKDEAEGLQFRAEQARREGDAAVKASYINAVTSVVSYGASMGGWGGGPPSAASAGASASGAVSAQGYPMSPVPAGSVQTKLWE